MPEIHVRPIDQADAPSFWDVISRTYFSGQPIPEDRLAKGLQGRYGAVLNGRVVGAYTLKDYKISVGASTATCSGVAAVAVAPEIRGAGIGSAMLRHCVRESHAKGFVFSSLYPFREVFYRKFGYETVGRRSRISVPMHRMPSTESSLAVRVLDGSDFEALDAVYASFAHRRAGLVMRTAEQWSDQLCEPRRATIYVAGDPAEAYVAVEHETQFWKEQHFSEVVWATEEGYRAILAVMKGIGINKSSLSWHEPSDSPFVQKYMDQGVSVAVERPIMMRVCDVEAALLLLRPADSGEASFSVSDPLIEANCGTWTVRWNDGNIDVTRSTIPAVELSIQQLSQVLLGEPAYVDLVRNGGVSEDANLASLFVARPVYCMDFF